jgi:hypothetical protein
VAILHLRNLLVERSIVHFDPFRPYTQLVNQVIVGIARLVLKAAHIGVPKRITPSA